MSDNESDAEFFKNLTLWFASRAFKDVIPTTTPICRASTQSRANPAGAFVTAVLLRPQMAAGGGPRAARWRQWTRC
jgi:hypothetical protein